MLIYALSVAIATIYGRYHYAVDALAGFGVSLIAALLCFTALGLTSDRHLTGSGTHLVARAGGLPVLPVIRFLLLEMNPCLAGKNVYRAKRCGFIALIPGTQKGPLIALDREIAASARAPVGHDRLREILTGGFRRDENQQGTDGAIDGLLAGKVAANKRAIIHQGVGLRSRGSIFLRDLPGSVIGPKRA